MIPLDSLILRHCSSKSKHSSLYCTSSSLTDLRNVATFCHHQNVFIISIGSIILVQLQLRHLLKLMVLQLIYKMDCFARTALPAPPSGSCNLNFSIPAKTKVNQRSLTMFPRHFSFSIDGDYRNLDSDHSYTDSIPAPVPYL